MADETKAPIDRRAVVRIAGMASVVASYGIFIFDAGDVLAFGIAVVGILAIVAPDMVADFPLPWK